MEKLLIPKINIPQSHSNIVPRRRLIEQLNAGVNARLTLISAPAGFGKTTLMSEWIKQTGRITAWVSLDKGDNDVVRFLAYFITALQKIWAGMGESALAVVQSPQPPQIEALLTGLINEIAEILDTPQADLPLGRPQDKREGLVHEFTLTLDDYHVLEAQPIHAAITFLIEHLPAKMHFIIITREDPPLPLARWRAQGQMTEIRAGDLRFTGAEADTFLNQYMGLDLAMEDIAELEARTEGWIAGLHLAALSLQAHKNRTDFIRSFAGDDRHVMDYLVGEVLSLQTERVQRFLLNTSILERMSGELCDAVMNGDEAKLDSQYILERLEQANLFIVPLDN